MMIYGIIGKDVTLEAVTLTLRNAAKVRHITVRQLWRWGSNQTTAIDNLLKAHSARVLTINAGTAGSSGSIIFMAGDERMMRQGSLFMRPIPPLHLLPVVKLVR